MIYRTDTYWEDRYNQEGIKTPVSKNVHPQDKYDEKIGNDCKIINDSLEPLFKATSVDLAIDCGCGCGRLTPVLFRYGKKIKGFDISPKAISLADGFVGYFSKPVEFICSPLTSIPLEDGISGLSLSWTVLQHISDPDEWKKAIDEIQRVVKVNGVILTYDNVEWNLNRMKNPEVKVPEHMSIKSANDYLFAFDRCDCLHQKMYNKHVLTVLRKVK